MASTKKLTKEIFIERSNNIHNNFFDYSKVEYINQKIKIIIGCSKHNDFLQTPKDHLNGAGCAKCGIESKSLNQKSLINKFNRIHNNKFDYSKVIYKNLDTDIIVICPIHKDFLVSPKRHLNGADCWECSYISRRLGNDKFKLKGGALYNNYYIYDKVNYINCSTYIIITCPLHGDFEETPNGHLSGRACSRCNKKKILIQHEWLDYLKIPNLWREKYIKIEEKGFYCDALDEENKTIYEFNGDFYHGNPKKYKAEDLNVKTKIKFGELYQRTLAKEAALKSAGYKIVSIWESEWKDLKKSLIAEPLTTRE